MYFLLIDESAYILLTKEQLIEEWRPNENHCPPLDNKQIQRMLQETIEFLTEFQLQQH
jgi:hypothetical protein